MADEIERREERWKDLKKSKEETYFERKNREAIEKLKQRREEPSEKKPTPSDREG